MTAATNITELTAMIVASFVANNALRVTDLPALISATHAALSRLDTAGGAARAEPTPAVPIESSVTHDYLICLIDGQKLRSLRRYLQRKYSLTPEAYREMWRLPQDYPMVAPAYAELRSRIARRKPSGKANPSGR
jgi:predicted transcriptional regulator